jgi:replication factor C subunit 3/5
MNPYLYGYNDKTVISTLVKEISSTYEILSKTRKIIIIKNVDKLSREAINSLRVIIEKNYRTCIFILISNNVSRLNGPILSRCSLIRLHTPSSESVVDLCNHILNVEKIKIPIKKLDLIKTQSGTYINNLILLIEYYSIFKKCTKIVNLEEHWSNKIIEYIIKTPLDLDNIHKIREAITHIIHNNIDINDIFIYIAYYFIDTIKNKDIDLIYSIIDSAQEYQMNSVKGNRDFLHIESFILHVFYIYHNNIIQSKVSV